MRAVIMSEFGVAERKLAAVARGVEAVERNLLTDDGLKMQLVSLARGYEFPGLSGNEDVVDPAFIDRIPDWADGAMNILVTARQLGAKALHGLGPYRRGIAIVSTYEIDQAAPDEPYELLATTIHETGHAVGLVTPGHSQFDVATAHCKNICTMQTVNKTAHDLAAMALRVKDTLPTGGFCDDCRSDLQQVAH